MLRAARSSLRPRNYDQESGDSSRRKGEEEKQQEAKMAVCTVRAATACNMVYLSPETYNRAISMRSKRGVNLTKSQLRGFGGVFQTMGLGNLMRLCTHMERRYVHRGHRILQQGERASHYYLLAQGQVELVSNHAKKVQNTPAGVVDPNDEVLGIHDRPNRKKEELRHWSEEYDTPHQRKKMSFHKVLANLIPERHPSEADSVSKGIQMDRTAYMSDTAKRLRVIKQRVEECKLQAASSPISDTDHTFDPAALQEEVLRDLKVSLGLATVPHGACFPQEAIINMHEEKENHAGVEAGAWRCEVSVVAKEDCMLLVVPIADLAKTLKPLPFARLVEQSYRALLWRRGRLRNVETNFFKTLWPILAPHLSLAQYPINQPWGIKRYRCAKKQIGSIKDFQQLMRMLKCSLQQKQPATVSSVPSGSDDQMPTDMSRNSLATTLEQDSDNTAKNASIKTLLDDRDNILTPMAPQTPRAQKTALNTLSQSKRNELNSPFGRATPDYHAWLKQTQSVDFLNVVSCFV